MTPSYCDEVFLIAKANVRNGRRAIDMCFYDALIPCQNGLNETPRVLASLRMPITDLEFPRPDGTYELHAKVFPPTKKLVDDL